MGSSLGSSLGGSLFGNKPQEHQATSGGLFSGIGGGSASAGLFSGLGTNNTMGGYSGMQTHNPNVMYNSQQLEQIQKLIVSNNFLGVPLGGKIFN